MVANTTLEIYDSKFISKAQERFYSIPDPNWQFIPPDVAFREAYETFGDNIFPLYNVFRIDVPQTADERSSLGEFAVPMKTNNKLKTIEIYKVFLKYQVDFFSNSMFDMNLSVMDFFRFKKDRQLNFDFKEIGLEGEEYYSEVQFEDPEDNTDPTDDLIHKVGRFMHYTYLIQLTAVLMDVRQEVPLNKIVVDFYNAKVTPGTKVYSLDISKIKKGP